MKSSLKYIFILILFIIYTFISAYSYANTVSKNIAESVFRLHVIANSNSEEDQNLKYKVRDAVIKYVNTISNSKNSKEDVQKLINENYNKILSIAESVIKDNGYNYSVKVNIGNFAFPTKTYGDISFPAGFYDAVKIEIAEAKGENWWCVMFPPLCFVDVSSGIIPDESKENMQESLEYEEYELLSSDTSEIKFKFKILELFQKAKVSTAKN